ncbi:S8 family serine peptidase, partial [Streptomyces sp. tea 10]|nr:S8 family serine peptidase [Streptomyces sp. tea 10]
MGRLRTRGALSLAAVGLLVGGAGAAPALAVEPMPAPSVPVETPIAPPPGDKVPVETVDVRQEEYWLDDYGVRDAWKSATGKGVKIAVIDTGVDGSHQDLKDAVGEGTDVSGVGKANGQDGLGAEPEHGTLVASLAAGRGHGPANQD